MKYKIDFLKILIGIVDAVLMPIVMVLLMINLCLVYKSVASISIIYVIRIAPLIIITNLACYILKLAAIHRQVEISITIIHYICFTCISIIGGILVGIISYFM